MAISTFGSEMDPITLDAGTAFMGDDLSGGRLTGGGDDTVDFTNDDDTDDDVGEMNLDREEEIGGVTVRCSSFLVGSVSRISIALVATVFISAKVGFAFVAGFVSGKSPINDSAEEEPRTANTSRGALATPEELETARGGTARGGSVSGKDDADELLDASSF